MNGAARAILKSTAAIPAITAAIAVIGCSSVSQSSQDVPPPGRGFEAGNPNGARERPAEMFSIVLKLTEEGIEKVRVDRADNTLNRKDPHRLEPTFYRVLDTGGGIVFERGFKMPTEFRSEMPDENGNLKGVRVPMEESIFTIKVPAFSNLEIIRLFRAGPGRTRENAELLGEVRP